MDSLCDRESTREEALEAGAALLGPGGITRLVEAGRLPGAIDIITLATLPPEPGARGGWNTKPAGSGVGLRWEDAFITTVGEAVERHSLVPDARALRRMVSGSYRDLTGRGGAPGGREAIDPRAIPLYRAAQYRRPGFPFRPFAADEAIRWYPAVSLTRGRPVWVPAECVFFGTDEVPSEHLACTSSGAASGLSWSEALLAAALELVERDAFMLAWFRGASLPAADPGAFGDPGLAAVCRRCARAGVTLQLRDLTTEIGIPTYLAIARAEPGALPALGVGAAARLSPAAAARKAALEATHTWNWALLKLDLRGTTEPPEDFASYPFEDFGDHVYLYAHPWMERHAEFLLREGEATARPAISEPAAARSVADALAEVVRRIGAAGFEVLAIDQGAAQLEAFGYRVARALAPGLVPLHLGVGREYLAPGRVPERPNLDPHPFP